MARAVVGKITEMACNLAARMKGAAAHKRDLRHLDARMLQDIGLEPFDVYFGWRRSTH